MLFDRFYNILSKNKRKKLRNVIKTERRLAK